MNRRRLLGALGLAGVGLGAAPLLAACTSDSTDGAATGAPTATTASGPRAEAAAVEAALLLATVNVIARFPATALTLEPVRDAHRAHLSALGAQEPTAEPTAPGSPRLPATGKAAVRQLARLERDSAADHAATALAADAPTARLVAALAAYCAAQHLVLDRSTR